MICFHVRLELNGIRIATHVRVHQLEEVYARKRLVDVENERKMNVNLEPPGRMTAICVGAYRMEGLHVQERLVQSKNGKHEHKDVYQGRYSKGIATPADVLEMV